MIIRLTFGLLCVVIMLRGVADAAPTIITLCHEDKPSYPWLLENGQGLSQRMMLMVGQELGVDIQSKEMPWLRCMNEVKMGHVDGLYKISFRKERMELGVYPINNDQPDSNFRMLIDQYYLYRIKDARLKWDGYVIKNAEKGIAAQAGFSIVEYLKKQGLIVDSSARSQDVILHKLLLGRVDGAALQSREADALIENNPALRGKVEKIGPPLQTMPYFLIFSHFFISSIQKSLGEFGMLSRRSGNRLLILQYARRCQKSNSSVAYIDFLLYSNGVGT